MNRKIHKALIPAAGAGKRMGYLSSILPKCLFPLAEKPILHRVVENAMLLGAREFVVITHFKEHMVQDYCLKTLAPELGVRVEFVHQDRMSGLADAILLGREFIQEPFAVILGDDYTAAADFNNVLDMFFTHPQAVVVEGIVPEPSRSQLSAACCVERAADGRILRIQEKPAEPFSRFRGTGFYLFRPDVFEMIENTPITPQRNEREITETIRLLAEAGKGYAEFLRGINLNINTFDDLLAAWNTHAHLATFLASVHGEGGPSALPEPPPGNRVSPKEAP